MCKKTKYLIFIVTIVLIVGCFLSACSVDNGGEVDLETQAKQDYLDNYMKSEHFGATVNDISFRPFLGIYNGSLVAVFYGGKYHGLFPEVEISYELEELTFAFSKGYPILVWNEGNIYELPQAYEQGLLKKEDIVKVHDLYCKK